MQRTKVSSTNIASIGYDADASILEVEFLNGGLYQYLDVPRSEYNGLMAADSHGSYLAQRVKNRYRFKKLA